MAGGICGAEKTFLTVFFYWDKKMAVLSTYVGQGQSMLGEVKLQ